MNKESTPKSSLKMKEIDESEDAEDESDWDGEVKYFHRM